MICNNCGQRFHASRINEVRGGCNPAPLERAIVNDAVVLRTEDLRQGLKYF
ncbi:MAG: Fe-S-containing protein [Desulfocurvibacter africanus]